MVKYQAVARWESNPIKVGKSRQFDGQLKKNRVLDELKKHGAIDLYQMSNCR
jgi:hypothetical protein